MFPRLVFILSVSFSISAWSADLQQVYEQAKISDPTFQSENFNYLAGKEVVSQALAPFLPQIEGSYARVRNTDDIDSPSSVFPVGRAHYNSNELGVTLKQSIYSHVNYVGLKQAKKQGRIAELDFENARQSLILRTAQSYFDWLAAQDNLALAQAEKKAVRRQLDLTNDQQKVGLGTKTDLYDAQARYSLAEAAEISALNRFEDARQGLAVLVGKVPKALTPLRQDIPLNSIGPDVRYWLGIALKNNINLKIARNRKEAVAREVSKQRSGHYPSLDFIASYRDVDADGGVTGSENQNQVTDLSLQLTVPIFQGGVVVSRTREAKARFSATEQEENKLRRVTEREIRATYQALLGSLSQVKALREAVVASESALEAKKEGFGIGLNTNLVVLDAQRDLYRAKRDWLQARYEYILSRLRLKRAAGTLSERDLLIINKWLG